MKYQDLSSDENLVDTNFIFSCSNSISSWTLEDKIRIHSRAYNILYSLTREWKAYVIEAKNVNRDWPIGGILAILLFLYKVRCLEWLT